MAVKYSARVVKYFFIFLFINSVTSCVLIKELVPSSPSPSITVDDVLPIQSDELVPESDVSMEYFYIKGFNEPHTPPNIEPTQALKNFLLETSGSIDLNRSGIIRYYSSDVNTTSKLKKIIIMLPGIYSGGGTLANLGLSLKRRINDCEVWIWERRSNLLEDRRIILKALVDDNPTLLTGLLEPGQMKLKNKDTAFYQPSTVDISFLAYWGLNVLMYDLYEVIKEARQRADEVVLSGYSLGVLYVTSFLASVFKDQDQIIPGHKLIDKVILFDGPPMLDGYIHNEKEYQSGVTIIPYNIIEGKEKLESGKYYPANASVDRDMSIFFLNELRAALAVLDPGGLSPEPYNTGTKKIPITNLAKYLIETDDNYQVFKLFTTTFGRANALQIGKFDYNSTVSVTGLVPGTNAIDWIPRKPGDTVEYNNYKTYLKAALHSKFNMPEWYQPTRILLDFGAIHHNDTRNGWQKKYFNLIENKNINLPFLCIGLSRGLSSRIKIYLDYKAQIGSSQFTIIMLNNITHLDGDTITDDESRPFLADIATHWLDQKKLIKLEANNYKKAVIIDR